MKWVHRSLGFANLVNNWLDSCTTRQSVNVRKPCHSMQHWEQVPQKKQEQPTGLEFKALGLLIIPVITMGMSSHLLWWRMRSTSAMTLWVSCHLCFRPGLLIVLVFFGASTDSELFCLEVDSSVDLGFSGYAQRAPKTFFFFFVFCFLLLTKRLSPVTIHHLNILRMYKLQHWASDSWKLGVT